MARRIKASVPSNALFDSGVEFHQRGDLQKAEHIYRQVLAQDRRHADALHMLGLLGAQSGHLEEGAALMRQAIDIEARNPDFHNNLGMAMLQQGRADEAAGHFRAAIDCRAAFPEAHFNLGNALLKAGRRGDAIEAFRGALNHRPDYLEAMQNLGAALVQEARQAEAIPVLEEIIRRQRRPSGKTRFLLGVAYASESRIRDAIATLNRHLEQEPDDSRALILLGDCYGKLGAYRNAVDTLRRACELDPDAFEARYALAYALHSSGNFDAARIETDLIKERDPEFADAWNLSGVMHQVNGDLAAAREDFEHCLALHPGHSSAIKNLAESARYKQSDDALTAQIRTLLQAPGLRLQDRVNLNFALGKLLDDCGDYDAAFAAFAEANAAKRRLAGYDAADQSAQIDRLTAAFSATLFADSPPRGNDSERPIFIVGMPRSGTSLVEQILASHARVSGAGELTYFTGITTNLGERLGLERPYPECAALLDEAHLAELAAGYLTLLDNKHAGAEFVIDKMPYNFLHLGLIHLVFPRARVIHCRRDAVDTCLSIFMRDFVGMHSYSYDLNDIATAYRQYRRVMAHWQAVLPVAPIEVEYDALVADQEPETRRLLEQLELDWDPACLAFHKTTRQVRTASFWQVRQPLYKSASARWRKYEAHLGPLLEALR